MKVLTAYPYDEEPGALAMARDAVLAARLAERRWPPRAIRQHGWRGPTLSTGRVQAVPVDLLVEARHAGVEVVRRPTGGGWLLHLPGDLSVTHVDAGPLRAGQLRGAAETVASAIAAALHAAGCPGQVQRPGGGTERRAEVCFSRIDREEVADEHGVKVAGVAVAMRRRAALVQTAIPLVPAADASLRRFERRWDPQREPAVERLGRLEARLLGGEVSEALAALLETELTTAGWDPQWERQAQDTAPGMRVAPPPEGWDSAAENL